MRHKFSPPSIILNLSDLPTCTRHLLLFIIHTINSCSLTTQKIRIQATVPSFAEVGQHCPCRETGLSTERPVQRGFVSRKARNIVRAGRLMHSFTIAITNYNNVPLLWRKSRSNYRLFYIINSKENVLRKDLS